MANNNIEIEIKIPVTEQEFQNAKKILEATSKFSKKSEQEDEYFTPAHKNFLEPKHPFEWLSIRKRGSGFLLTYKHFHPENSEFMNYCDEIETEIKDGENLKKIFNSLNFKSLIIVKKQREMYKYKDEFEICLDTVDNLGSFIEIEAIKDFGSVDLTRLAITEFAKQLGLDGEKKATKGYPYLLMEKLGLIN